MKTVRQWITDISGAICAACFLAIVVVVCIIVGQLAVKFILSLVAGSLILTILIVAVVLFVISFITFAIARKKE